MVSSLQTSRSSRVVRAPAGAFGPTVLGTELAAETAVTMAGYRERISTNFLGVILVGSGVVRGMLVGCREFEWGWWVEGRVNSKVGRQGGRVDVTSAGGLGFLPYIEPSDYQDHHLYC